LSVSISRDSTSISLPWLTSPDINSRGRPGGRPQKSRLSPERIREDPLAATTRATELPTALPITDCLAARCTVSARHKHDGRRSLPPTAPGTGAAIRAGNHGVSDPGARAGNGPERVRRVAHAMTVGVPCRSSERPSSVPESPRIGSTCARGTGRRSSGQSGLVRAGNPGHKVALVPRAMTRLIRRPRCSRSFHAFGHASEQRAAPRRMRRPSRPRCWICARHRARLVAPLRPRMRAAFGP
jgi:hypothetical protein